uniref:Uncharacterized protein n=1 Tax=Cacopsylla melanoneura TaxID=428564 RepID=A0A8D8XFB4_9HEMI
MEQMLMLKNKEYKQYRSHSILHSASPRYAFTADPASVPIRLLSSQQYRSHSILHSASPRDALTADPASVLTRLLSSHQYRSHSISNQHDLETLSHCRSCLFSDSVNIESAISISDVDIC